MLGSTQMYQLLNTREYAVLWYEVSLIFQLHVGSTEAQHNATASAHKRDSAKGQSGGPGSKGQQR